MVSAEGTESVVAKRGTESLAMGEQLVEEVCERENCKQALPPVKANKGSAGVDGMTVSELHSGTYKPEPVKRVEIPKPSLVPPLAGCERRYCYRSHTAQTGGYDTAEQISSISSARSRR